MKARTKLAALIATFCALVLALAACHRQPPPLGSPDEVARFTRSNNALALDLYARARTAPGNVALSPFAVSTGLVMLWAGARGETAAQIQKVLHAEGTSEGAIETAGQIAKSLSHPARRVTFRAAARLFVDNNHPVEPAYQDRFAHAFGGPVEALDFASASDAGRRHVNDWVAKQTEGHIPELLPPSAVTAQTTCVIADTIYFQGGWKERFLEKETQVQPFHRTPTDTLRVPMMHDEHVSHRAAWVDGVEVLELPYEGDELAMTLVIPDDGSYGSAKRPPPEMQVHIEELASVEARLSAKLDAWLAALSPREVEVWLPRFEVAPRLALGDSLKALGMPLAFEPGRADFTAMARGGVFLDAMSHQVYVKVDEAGTTAAAGFGGEPAKAMYPVLRFDRPFLFFIRELRSGLILFMGRISDPTAH